MYRQFYYKLGAEVREEAYRVQCTCKDIVIFFEFRQPLLVAWLRNQQGAIAKVQP